MNVSGGYAYLTGKIPHPVPLPGGEGELVQGIKKNDLPSERHPLAFRERGRGEGGA